MSPSWKERDSSGMTRKTTGTRTLRTREEGACPRPLVATPRATTIATGLRLVNGVAPRQLARGVQGLGGLAPSRRILTGEICSRFTPFVIF